MLSHVWLFVIPQTAAHQAPLSMGFPRQEYWSGLPFPPPRDLLNPGIKPASPALAGRFFTVGALREALSHGWKESGSHSVISDSLRPHGLYIACQAPLFMEFSRPEYQSGQLFPPLGDLPNPGIEPRSPTMQADSLLSEPPGKPFTWLIPRYYVKVHFIHFPCYAFTVNYLKIVIPMVPYSFHGTYKFPILYKLHRKASFTQSYEKKLLIG